LSKTEELADNRPADLYAERTIIGACLLEQEARDQAFGVLKTDAFSLESHRRIWDIMLYLAEEGIETDQITLSAELRRQKALESVGGHAYLADLTVGIPFHLYIGNYIQIVKDKHLDRQLIELMDFGMMEASDQSKKAVEIIEQVRTRLDELSTGSLVKGFSTAAQVITERYKSVDEFFAGGSRAGTIRTHFPMLDRMTRLFKPSELIILAARPSMGKTGLALNIAANVALRDRMKVGIFSLEMASEKLLRRMLISESGLTANVLESGKMSTAEKDRGNATLERLMESPLHFEDTAFQTVNEMRAKARQLQRDKGLDLLIIDYLQLMESDKRENRTQEVSAISRGLKGLAKELSVPVIALSQLSRKCEERADKRPLLSDLRESGSIEQDADVVAFLFREEYYQRDNAELKGLTELHIAKNRDGETGLIQLVFLPELQRFAEREGHHHA
jgi:replicative DNA helicase